MDKQQLNNEFMSIISESHPGLTFEEYRDSCIFILFYHYLCLKYNDSLEDQYKLGAMVRLAVRGKLQMPVFLRFIDQASSYIHLAGSGYQLTDLSFYQMAMKNHQVEKQKSFARFLRKLIKKIDAWNSNDLLFEMYGELFEKLLSEFSRMKKDSFISEELVSLFDLVFEESNQDIHKVFLPEFRYGTLLKTMLRSQENPEIFGFEDRASFLETLGILCYMKGIPEESVHLYSREDWLKERDYEGYFDAISIMAPDGSEPGNYVWTVEPGDPLGSFMNSGTKGELPLILSALPLMADQGVLAVVIPSALLYREGKENQIRRYLIEEDGSLELIMLLPDQIFHSTGQNELLLVFKKNRSTKDIMFFDCSEMEGIDEQSLTKIREAWRKRDNISGFCAAVSPDLIRQNDYNLNLPRYVTRLMKLTEVDLQEKLARITAIEEELKEIDQKIAMYRRDLELS